MAEHEQELRELAQQAGDLAQRIRPADWAAGRPAEDFRRESTWRCQKRLRTQG